MKIALQYVNDINGKTQAVQLPLSEWEKVLNKLKKYEQALKLKSDLKEQELADLNTTLENAPDCNNNLKIYSLVTILPFITTCMLQ